MIATTSEGEATEEIMQEQRKDDLFNKSLKRAGSSRLPTRGVEGLTCSEAEVDALLSDGEST